MKVYCYLSQLKEEFLVIFAKKFLKLFLTDGVSRDSFALEENPHLEEQTQLETALGLGTQITFSE